MLTRNTSYIKVAELLEHQIACHQNLYKDYDQKLSAYLDFLPTYQASNQNDEQRVPQNIAGKYHADVWGGVYERKALSGDAQ